MIVGWELTAPRSPEKPMVHGEYISSGEEPELSQIRASWVMIIDGMQETRHVFDNEGPSYQSQILDAFKWGA